MGTSQCTIPRTCFTRGTMTHLTADGRRTLCGAWVALECSTGSTPPTEESVDTPSACQRPGCKQGWYAWVAAGGTLESW